MGLFKQLLIWLEVSFNNWVFGLIFTPFTDLCCLPVVDLDNQRVSYNKLAGWRLGTSAGCHNHLWSCSSKKPAAIFSEKPCIRVISFPDRIFIPARCKNLWKKWSNFWNFTEKQVSKPWTMSNYSIGWVNLYLKWEKRDGTGYPPKHSIMSAVVCWDTSDKVDFFHIFQLHCCFRFQLTSLGFGSKEPLTEEELLWSTWQLTHRLLSTLLYINGIYFTLQSGQEHQKFCFEPPQKEILSLNKSEPSFWRHLTIIKSCYIQHENT